MKKKVTMQDIANELNISKNSVSQALTGKPGVSEETRFMVQQMANRLGYTYPGNKPASKTLGQKKGLNFALIASDFAFSLKSFFGEIYLSVEKEARARGINLFIESIDQTSADQLTLPSLLTNHQIDGILILSHIRDEYILSIIETGIPVVLIDHHSPYLQVDSILTNNRFGAYSAVEHLIKLGHGDIAFVGDTTFSPSYQERLDGYILALTKHGIEPNPSFIYKKAQEKDEEIQGYIKNLNEAPTAWFCVNDGLGFLVQSTLQRNGYSVPDDASVCSFDNGQLSQIANPKITTVNIDLHYYGKKAVEQLCWRIHNKNEPIHEILLPTNIIQRESTSKRKLS
ncbi:LacI family transcriptional regulator [Bacillus sp. FJAT-27225]|uniref:LacI family DNA-binding transcriptional regulator n=1 Tax=Bacillus sp. FJAT-27225 TaxID=1743144 RepID=UPI00080C231C|nr:LacI family DNA-binding transcriptional regulator [Bacillus sp. FJAT-27225]OCA87848.1 LacI family transcriptional regulator [Bacillus sp. FJAT-27225]